MKSEDRKWLGMRLWLACSLTVPASCHEKTAFQVVAGPRRMRVTQSRVEAAGLEPSAAEAPVGLGSTQRWNRAEDCLVTDNKNLWVSLHGVSVTNLSDVPQALFLL